jgi:RNA polymerase sigma-70 factor (ECF subfamily)
LTPIAEPRPTETALEFDAVYRAHAAFVWRASASLGVPEAEREDLVHDVFLVVHRRLHEFDARAAMRTWLFGIAKGLARNRRRSAARAERKLRVLPPPPPAEKPDDVVERSRATEAVAAFLGGLKPELREVFELVEVEGIRVPEVAELTGINPNTAYTRLRAARKAFARYVASLDGGPGDG